MSSINPTTLRLTGMASGLDTESIVRDLMEVSKLKVENVKKQKVLLEWKQEYYQEILSKLSAFQNKYYGSSSTNSLAGGSLNMLTATYNSPYVSIQAGSNAAQGSMYIADIVSLASSARLEGTRTVSANPSISINRDALLDLAGKSIVVSLDGVKKTITFSDRAYETSQDVQQELSAKLASAFGANRINVTLDGDALTLSTDNSELRISVPTDPQSNPTGILDFANYSSNRLEFNVSLSQAGLLRNVFESPEDQEISFSINGKTFTFTAQSTLNDIMKAVNSSDAGVTMTYSALTDTFSLVSKASGAASAVTVQDSHGFLMDALFGGGRFTAGTDAIVRMSTNGSKDEADLITVQRSSNSFSVNGSTITLLGKAEGETLEGISVNVSYDTTAIVERVKAFVNDYNELLKLITTRTSEERFRDYEPLSDDEKEALSEKEIELWNAKAKSGILRNDAALKAIESELKSCMYSAVKELGDPDKIFGILAEIGISTGNYSEKGQLHLDEKKLREALETDTQKVLGMLTQQSSVSFSLYASQESQQKRFSESGVFWRLSDVLAKNLNTVGKKGALIHLVGSPQSGYKGETEYSTRIKNIQSRIDRMNDQLIRQEDRYWKQFTAMESALAKLNSQSSWLAGMLGQGQK